MKQHPTRSFKQRPISPSGRYLSIHNKKQFAKFFPKNPDLPRLAWIKKHRHVKTFKKEKKGQWIYTDELGFFRCLTVHLGVDDKEIEAKRCRTMFSTNMQKDFAKQMMVCIICRQDIARALPAFVA